MGRLRHQLVGLDHGEVGEAAEVGLEAPDELVGGEHRVVVGARVLVVDVVAVHGHPVTGLPVAHRRADADDDGRRVGADHVVRQRVALAPLVLAAHLVEEAERRQRLEDRRPHRVEVDARRHHGDVHLVGCQLRRGDLVDVERLARILVPRIDALEHGGVLAAHERRPVALGNREVGDVVAARTGLDGFEDLLHGARRYRSVITADKAGHRAPEPRNVARFVALERNAGGIFRDVGGGVAFRYGFYRFVHRRWRSHPDREDERRALVVLRRRPRRVRHRRRARTRRRGTRRGRARHHGSGAHGRPGPGAQPPGRRQGRHPDERAVGQHQQGVPVRPQLDLPRQPDDRRR